MLSIYSRVYEWAWADREKKTRILFLHFPLLACWLRSQCENAHWLTWEPIECGEMGLGNIFIGVPSHVPLACCAATGWSLWWSCSGGSLDPPSWTWWNVLWWRHVPWSRKPEWRSIRHLFGIICFCITSDWPGHITADYKRQTVTQV